MLIVFFLIDDGEISKTLQFDTRKTSEVWRYFTYSFVHFNLEHLGVNICLLILLCANRQVQAHTGFRWIFYFSFGVVSGSLAYFVFDSETLLGCSGGVYSLVGASMSTIILDWSCRKEKVILLKYSKHTAPLAFASWMYQVPWLVTIVIIVSFEIFSIAKNQMLRMYNYCGIAHFFGFLTGLSLGFN